MDQLEKSHVYTLYNLIVDSRKAMTLVNKVLFIALLLMTSTVMSAQVYRWIDGDGVVHFSDRPEQGAEKIVLRQVDTYTPVLPQPYIPDDVPVVKEEPVAKYTLLNIVMPEDDSVVWVTGGLMQALVAIDPELQPGHRIALFLNGSLVEGTPVADTVINATGIIRGTHQLQAAVVDTDNNELLRSDPITIHARAHSIFDRLRRR